MTPNAETVFRHPVRCLAFGFGSGLSPHAPGTAGTLVAVPLYLLLSLLPESVYAALILLAFVAGIYLCGRTARDLEVHDHPGIVWDEFVGYWITMLAAPSGWTWLLFGFVLFRLFDIVKPWPIRRIDHSVPGGLGIMLDDVLAGCYALVVMQVTAAIVL